MTRITGNSLMFDEEEVKATTAHLPRLIRVIFYGLGITNEGYLERYRHYFRAMFPDKNKKEFSQKSTADRKFLMERRKLTFNMVQGIMLAMGYDVESVTIKLRDKLSGEIKTFSTEDTVESLKKALEKGNDGSIDSLM